MRLVFAIALLAGCGSTKPTPAPPVATTTSGPSTSASSTTTASAPSDCPVDAIAARIAKEWGAPDSPRASFAGAVGDVSKRVQSYDKQRRDWVDELRSHTTGACASLAHVQIGIVDDTFRAAVLHSKLETMPPDANAKLVEMESKANKVLTDPKSTPDEKERAKELLEKAKQIRENTADMGRTALRGWSAYAEMEAIDSYARGMIAARKAGLKGSIYAFAWKRMGVFTKELGLELMNERLERAKKDHPDVPLDANQFLSACSWPAGC